MRLPVLLAILATGLLATPACKKKSPAAAPAAPAPPAPTATFTATPTATLVYPGILFQGSVSRAAAVNGMTIDLTLAVNDAAETTAAVTLSHSGGAVAVPYAGPVTYSTGTPVSIFSRYLASGTGSVGGWSYAAGQACTLSATTSLGTASGAVTMPGDITLLPDGSQASWSTEGTSDVIQVVFQPTSSLVYQSPGVDTPSPHNIPATVYANSGQYRITVGVGHNNPLVSNAATGSWMIGLDDLEAFVTVP